jgi:hypothetical protein
VGHCVERLVVRFWDDLGVAGSKRRDVEEGQQLGILVHDHRVHSAGRDATEQAVRQATLRRAAPVKTRA